MSFKWKSKKMEVLLAAELCCEFFIIGFFRPLEANRSTTPTGLQKKQAVVFCPPPPFRRTGLGGEKDAFISPNRPNDLRSMTSAADTRTSLTTTRSH